MAAGVGPPRSARDRSVHAFLETSAQKRSRLMPFPQVPGAHDHEPRAADPTAGRPLSDPIRGAAVIQFLSFGGTIAQLVRASALHAECRRFESCWSHHSR